jgi:hypothetical protein
MRLILTTATPSNAVYTDASGAPQYKVNTPFALHDRTTAISRVVAHDIPRRHSQSTDGHEAEPQERERFAGLAHIDWHLLDSSVIRFGGRELATRDFFRKEGWGWYGQLVSTCVSAIKWAHAPRPAATVFSQQATAENINGSLAHTLRRRVLLPPPEALPTHDN